MKFKIFAIALFTVTAITASAGTSAGFLNVDITATQGEAGPTEVKLRIPLGLINVMAPQLEETLAGIDMQQEGLDLKEMWQSIKESGPNRFADIQSADGDVTVETTETHLEISVSGTEQGALNVKLPLALGDALFGAESTDLEGLMTALQGLEGDLVTIEGDLVQGRVWMD